ncbi:MAG: hypothetical protein WBP61_07330, partial [Nocardioides sp.]
MASSRITPLRALLPTAVLALALAGCGGEESDTAADESSTSPQSATATPTPEQSSPDKGDKGDEGEPATPAGQLVTWDDYDADRAAYADSDVVLYFHADWCHDCQATEASIEADGIPDGLTLVEID